MGCFTIGEILTALLVSIHLLCSGIKFLPKEKPLGIFCLSAAALSTVLLLLGAGLGNPLFKRLYYVSTILSVLIAVIWNYKLGKFDNL